MVFTTRHLCLRLTIIALFAFSCTAYGAPALELTPPLKNGQVVRPVPGDNDKNYYPALPDSRNPQKTPQQRKRKPIIIINPDANKNDPRLKQILEKYGSDGYYYYYYQQPDGNPEDAPQDNDSTYVHPLLFN